MITGFYFTLLIFGAFYLLFASLTHIDFLIGKFALGLPYSFIGWGILGLLTDNEPQSFLYGFLLPFLLIAALYSFVTSDGSTYEQFIFKKGIVTVPIQPNKKGEIKIERGKGYDFLVAKAENLIKPILKGEEVRIIDVEGVIAVVAIDTQHIKPANRRSRLYHNIFRIIRILTPRPRFSGICMICYGGMNREKNGLACPSCGSIAHNDHFIDWLEINGSCPNCRTSLEYRKSKLKVLS